MTKTMILYECKNDEEIARIISGIMGGAKLKHEGGKSEVLKEAFEKSCGEHVIAIIDHDPGATWPGRFQQVPNSMREIDENTYIYTETHCGNKIIVLILSPRLEDWLVSKCKRKIDLKTDPRMLHRDKGSFNKILNKCRDVVEDIAEKIKKQALDL